MARALATLLRALEQAWQTEQTPRHPPPPPPHSTATRIARSKRRHTRLDEGMPLSEERDRPHDITAGKAENQSTAPYRLILALGAEKVRGRTEGDDDHEADEEGPAIRHSIPYSLLPLPSAFCRLPF